MALTQNELRRPLTQSELDAQSKSAHQKTPAELANERMANHKSVQVTYNPKPGDPMKTKVFGQDVEAGKPFTLTDPVMIEKATNNPWFTVAGAKDQAEHDKDGKDKPVQFVGPGGRSNEADHLGEDDDGAKSKAEEERRIAIAKAEQTFNEVKDGGRTMKSGQAKPATPPRA